MAPARLIPLLALAALAHGADSPPTTRPAATPGTIAYVGVGTSAAPASLRARLALPRGVGVVVEIVEPDSPAARAGLAVHDVVTRFDDQIITNVQQLGTLVGLRRAGERVTLGVVRDGRPVTVDVVLAERSVPVDEAAVAETPAGRARLSSIATHTDAQHVITLITHGDADRHVRIADSAGHVIYDGPLNSPDDAARLPAECRAKVDAVDEKFERFKRQRAATPAP